MHNICSNPDITLPESDSLLYKNEYLQNPKCYMKSISSIYILNGKILRKKKFPHWIFTKSHRKQLWKEKQFCLHNLTKDIWASLRKLSFFRNWKTASRTLAKISCPSNLYSLEKQMGLLEWVRHHWAQNSLTDYNILKLSLNDLSM